MPAPARSVIVVGNLPVEDLHEDHETVENILMKKRKPAQSGHRLPQQLKGQGLSSRCSWFVGVHAARIAATHDLFPFEPSETAEALRKPAKETMAKLTPDAQI